MNHRCRVETVHEGSLFKVQALSCTDARGRAVRREVVRHPGAVVVVPVLDADNLVMIRNYRVAVDDRLWEFPAGKLEPGEDPQQAALRELEEETGYSAARSRKLGEFYTSPGFADELMHAYVGEGLTHVGQRLEAGEDIEVQTVPRADALRMVHDGRLRDGKSIAALLMWTTGDFGLGILDFGLQKAAEPRQSKIQDPKSKIPSQGGSP